MTPPTDGRAPLDPVILATAPWPVEVVASLPSTNAELARLAREGGAQTAEQVLVTEHQTAGRGRLDRGWETPDRAALTFSTLLQAPLSPEQWPWLPLLTGYVVRRALPVAATLKWPNDVLVGDRKIAGILLERVGDAAIIGIGLNVSTTRDELPVPQSTSLALEGVDIDRTELLLSLLRGLHVSWRRWLDEPSWLRPAYADACATVGRRVRADLPGGASLDGVAEGLDEAGRLLVRVGGDETTPGRLSAVAAGDVVHLRDGARG